MTDGIRKPNFIELVLPTSSIWGTPVEHSREFPSIRARPLKIEGKRFEPEMQFQGRSESLFREGSDAAIDGIDNPVQAIATID